MSVSHSHTVVVATTQLRFHSNSSKGNNTTESQSQKPKPKAKTKTTKTTTTTNNNGVDNTCLVKLEQMVEHTEEVVGRLGTGQLDLATDNKVWDSGDLDTDRYVAQVREAKCSRG